MTGARGESSPKRPAGRWRARAGWLAALLVLLPWWTVREGPYHFDDKSTPLTDPASQSLAAWFSHLTVTLRPLSKLTFALESQAGWSQLPSLRRADSVLLLALEAVVLFSLLVRLRAKLAAALAITIAYGVHPIRAEEVLSLAGRSSLMASTLVLGSLLLADRGRDKASLALFVLACFSRETAVFGLLPLAAIVLGRSGTGAAAFRRLEWHAAASLVFLSYLVWHHRYGQLADYSFHARPYASTIARQLGAIPIGISLWVRPSALSIDHGESISSSWLSATTLGGLLILIAVGAVAVFTTLAAAKLRPTIVSAQAKNRAARSRWNDLRTVAVGASLVLAALLPTQTLMPKIDSLTERPFAFALVGGLIMLVPWVRRGLEAHGLSILVAAAVLLFFGAASVERGKLYATDLALWADAARKSESNARPHYNYALALEDDGRDDEARVEIEKAHAIDPFDWDIRDRYVRDTSAPAP